MKLEVNSQQMTNQELLAPSTYYSVLNNSTLYKFAEWISKNVK